MSVGARFKNRVEAMLFPLLLAILLLLSTRLSDELSGYVRQGMSLAAGVIIPSVFPFMILSDLIACTADFSGMRRIGRIFERVFSVRATALGATIIGMLGGFPIGARMAADLYRRGCLSRRDAEVVAAVASTPSLAFTVSGVGAAMLGSASRGVMLYVAVILSAVITGAVVRGDARQGADSSPEKRHFSPLDSIESASRSSLGIIGVVTAFSAVSGLVRDFVGSEAAVALILPLLELGGAASFIASAGIGEGIRAALMGFALGFSGLSVHLQVRGALAGTDIGYKRFLLMKLAEGGLAALLSCVLCCLA